MSIQHLRTFVEVYRQRSISEAARVLGMTQPAVSQHVAALEAQLARPLFERHARGVRPTIIAEDLAANLGDTLNVAEAALAGVKARSARLSGTVHIAAPSDYLAENIAPCLEALVTAGLDLRLHIGGREALYAMLLEDRVHLALTASRLEDPRLAFEPIGVERLLAVAAPAVAARIAACADLATALGDTAHIAYDLDRPLLRDWLSVNGLSLPGRAPAVTVADLRVLRAMLLNRVGWTVLPDYLTIEERRAGRLVVIPAPIRSPENTFHLVWEKSALRHPRVAFARDVLLRALSVRRG
ncbi:LysR family transcriptional regulator [Stappia sp. ICDLI1TA098]|jgi:DNA-binding transcriptional LysR family regulator